MMGYNRRYVVDEVLNDTESLLTSSRSSSQSTLASGIHDNNDIDVENGKRSNVVAVVVAAAASSSSSSSTGQERLQVKLNKLYRETLWVRFFAGILLHIQSLYYTFKFHGLSRDSLWCTIGAGMEGMFFISIFIWSFRGIWCAGSSSTRTIDSSSDTSPMKPSLSVLHRYMPNLSLWRIGVCLFLLVTAIAVILSDVGFQQKTGGERPDMWVILSHIRNFSSGVKGEFKDSSKGAMTLIYGCLTSLFMAVTVCVAQEKRVSKFIPGGGDILLLKPNKTLAVGISALLFMLILYMTDSWMPIFHTYASVTGSCFLSPPGSKEMTAALRINPLNTKRPRKGAPNIVVVMHESLSGELMMTHESSAKATPFFHEMLKSQDEYFVFEHARTVSGDTVDAISAIQSGCDPVDHKESRYYALKTTLATEFKSQGYKTVSFSSRGLVRLISCSKLIALYCFILSKSNLSSFRVLQNLAGTKWFMTQHQLTTNFDQVFDPTVTKDPLENPPGQDDRKMVENFKTWLTENHSGGDEPFYAQFYYFNSHYPFFDNKDKKSESRLDGMLETVDESIKRIFDILEETGNLDNTIVIGSADHGERRTPTKYGRLREWSKDILHVPIYVRMPRKFFNTDEEVKTLRYNTQQLVSTLDVYPTIMHLLSGESLEDYSEADEHCVRGYDLLDSKIKADRIALSFPGVSKNFSHDKYGNMAIHMGTSSSLLNRFGWPQDNSISVVEYAPIIGSRNKKSSEENKPLKMKKWKSIVKDMEETSFADVIAKKGRYLVELYKVLGVRPPF
jgi:hypothetical protein